MSGLIIPANIPGDDLDPRKLQDAAAVLKLAGTDAALKAEEAAASWALLPGVLESPEGPTIYGALAGPSDTALVVRTKFHAVAEALEDYAELLGPIKSTFATIKTDAVTFRNKIRADERAWMKPSETKAYEYDAQARVTTSRAVTRTVADVVEYLTGLGESTMVSGGRVLILRNWTESGTLVSENNALMDRLADAYTRLQNAEADCANAIHQQRGAYIPDIEHIEAWQLKQTGENTVVLPWGSKVDEDRNCGESFWHGVSSAGIEAFHGVAGLVGYNGMKDSWSWGNAGEAWLGLGKMVGALLVVSFPPSALLAQMNVPVFKDSYDMMTEMGKGLVAWDTWAENPSEAAGRALVNVGSLFIPGAGEVAAGVRGIAGAGRIARLADDVGLADDALAGLNKLENFTPNLTNLVGDAASAGAKMDDLVRTSVKLPDGDALHVGGKVDTPPPPHGGGPDTPPPPRGGDGPSTPVHPRDGDGPSTPTHPRDGDGPTTPRDGDGPTTPRDGDGPTTPRDGDGPTTPRDGDGPTTPRDGDGPTTPRDGDGPDAPGPGAATPGAYKLPDGSDYHPTMGRDATPRGPDSEPVLTEAAARHGLTMADLYNLIHERSVSSLTHAEARILLEIRESVPPPAAGEIMQKVMSADAFQDLISGQGKVPDSVGGFVGRADDGQKLVTSQDYYYGYGLDYGPGRRTPEFLAPNGSVADVYAVRFRLPDDVDLQVPNASLADRAGNNFPSHKPEYFHPDSVGALGPDNPYLGNGFVGRGATEIIPEYHFGNGVRHVLDDGTEIYRITPTGDEVLVAVRFQGKWEPVIP